MAHGADESAREGGVGHSRRVRPSGSQGNLRPCLKGEGDMHLMRSCKRKKPQADNMVRRKLHASRKAGKEGMTHV